MTVGIELVLIDLAAQGIAVNAKNSGSAGLVAIGAVQDALDKTLFEFADGFVKTVLARPKTIRPDSLAKFLGPVNFFDKAQVAVLAELEGQHGLTAIQD